MIISYLISSFSISTELIKNGMVCFDLIFLPLAFSPSIMSSTSSIRVLQIADNTESQFSLPNIDVTANVSAFIPVLVSFL